MKNNSKTNPGQTSGGRKIVRSRWGLAMAVMAVLVPLAIYAAEAGSSDSDGDGFLEFVADTVIEPDEMNTNFDVVADHIRTYEGAITVDEETGNVGIGTTNPDAPLGVASDDTSSNPVLRLRATTAGDESYVRLQGYAADNGAPRFADIGFDPDVQNIVFRNPHNSDARFVVASNGNVGIGTTAPAVELVVADSSTSSPRLHMQNSSTGYTSYDGFQISTSFGNGYLWNWENGATLFGTNNVERMRIDSSGNVGIGTTSPNRNLVVESGVDARLAIASTGTGTNFDAGLLLENKDATWQFENDDTPGGEGTLRILGGPNGGEKDVMALTKNGNVGIGTTSPEYALDVVGTVHADAVIDASDIRLKTDIAPLEDALSGVQCLDAVTYRWADPEKPQDLQIGLIAQEVERCFPEVVSTDERGYKSVSYARLVAPLAEAVKAQQGEISAQRQVIRGQQEVVRNQQREIREGIDQ